MGEFKKVKIGPFDCYVPNEDMSATATNDSLSFGWTGFKTALRNGRLHLEESNTPDIVYIHEVDNGKNA